MEKMIEEITGHCHLIYLAISGLAKVTGIFTQEVRTEEFLFTKTFFIRQRNRLINEAEVLVWEIENYCLKNSLEAQAQ